MQVWVKVQPKRAVEDYATGASSRVGATLTTAMHITSADVMSSEAHSYQTIHRIASRCQLDSSPL